MMSTYQKVLLNHPLSSSILAAASQMHLDYNFIQQNIPKVEFHAHLNGCIRSNTLRELAIERNVPYDSDLCESMSRQQRRTLEDCFEVFAMLPSIITDLEAIQRITQEALTDFASHHVSYLELRSTPKQLLDRYEKNCNIKGIIDAEVATKQKYVETVLDTIKNFNEAEESRYQLEMKEYNEITFNKSQHLPRLPMVTRFIVSIDQSKTLKECEENIQLAIDFVKDQNKYKDLVVGVDFCGNPTCNNWSMFQSSFQRARQSGLKITIHCAELPIIENLNDNDYEQHQKQIPTEVPQNLLYLEAKSMIDFHPDRLGHAIRLPISLRRMLLQQKIPVETCPTSNIMTTQMFDSQVSSSPSVYDFSTEIVEITRTKNTVLREWILSNHPIIVCTDDPTIFDTTVTNEIMIVFNAFAPEGLITLPQFLDKIILNAMNYSFCDDTTKQLVVDRVKGRLNEILACSV